MFIRYAAKSKVNKVFRCSRSIAFGPVNGSAGEAATADLCGKWHLDQAHGLHFCRLCRLLWVALFLRACVRRMK